MRTLFLLTCILVCTITVAQTDTLFFKNGKKKAVSIKFITEKEVKFKMPGDSTGPLIALSKRTLVLIFYKGVSYAPYELTGDSIKKENKLHKVGIISIDLAQLCIKHVHIYGEVIGKRRRFSVVGFLNKGLLSNRDAATYERKEVTVNPVYGGNGHYKNYYGGFDVKFFCDNKRKLKYWLAFGVETGETTVRIYQETTTYSPYWTTNGTGTTQKSLHYYSNLFWGFHHKNGIMWNVSKHFCLQADINIGINKFIEQRSFASTKKNNNYYIKYGLGLTAGIAF